MPWTFFNRPEDMSSGFLKVKTQPYHLQHLVKKKFITKKHIAAPQKNIAALPFFNKKTHRSHHHRSSPPLPPHSNTTAHHHHSSPPPQLHYYHHSSTTTTITRAPLCTSSSTPLLFNSFLNPSFV